MTARLGSLDELARQRACLASPASPSGNGKNRTLTKEAVTRSGVSRPRDMPYKWRYTTLGSPDDLQLTLELRCRLGDGRLIA